MVLAMLQQEFQMRFHRETRTIDVLALVVAKGGAKLRQATGDELAALNSSSPNSNRRKTGMSAGMFSSIAGQMDELAGGLSFDLQTPVVDKTNMTGFYDFTLTWAAGPGELMRGGQRSAGPSIFSALQSQLGLRLKSAKGPVNMIAIDHIAPPKTAN